MNFHLYYHDDLDGVASGAIFFFFLKKRGDDIISFTPLEYGINFDDKSSAWENFAFKIPSILVDFRYHPKVDWWIDHHASAFAKSEWQASYKDDGQHHWNPKAPSACGLVARFLSENHAYELSEKIQRLVVVVDMDDSAGYPTLESALELDSASKKIHLLLGDTEMKKNHATYLAFREFLIKNIISVGMDVITEMDEYSSRIALLRDQRISADLLSQENAQLRGKVIFSNKNGAAAHSSRWSVYQKYPEAPYSVQIIDKGSEFKVGIGSNKWSKEKPVIDLGSIARSHGGGGHFGVGALVVKTREDADHIASQIIDLLNSNHPIT